ncbi:MAG: RluA family pseudouridine synthase [Acidobacteriota bacterium]
MSLDLPRESRGERLDLALAALLPAQSRAALQRLMREGHVKLAGRIARPSDRVRGGERVVVDLPAPAPAAVRAEAVPLSVLYEDGDLIVVDKPPGLVVHPGAGVRSGTLVNALLHHCRDLSGVGGRERPGIVHRLDRDTSGVIVVAKHDAAHRNLAAQFKERRVVKTYEALVWGRPRRREATIDAPIGRHPTARVKMSVRRGGRAARTVYRILEDLGPVTLLELRPETGRTHQLRVHLSDGGHPIVGDRVYGGQRARSLGPSRERDALLAYGGLALHARGLALEHPRTGSRLEFRAPRPPDLKRLVALLKEVRPAPDRS